MFLMWMNIMGFDVTGEKLIKHGRIDGVFKDYDNNHVVICEVKYNRSSSKSLEELIEETLVQLKDRRYWMGYTTRRISLMAIAFKDEIIYDDKTMTLVKCRIEDFNHGQFSKNLRLIDSNLPDIISQVLLYYYSGKISDIKSLTELL
ncbi:MAG: HpaII family restriction endonuclease, partial [Methanobrevibacter sp.]|nr:HpaII family restriction endonuclease [Candidatus Methanovirga australis]